MNYRKRRIYYIEKDFQTKHLILTTILLLAYTFILVIVIFSPSVIKLYSDNPLYEKAEAARTLLLLHGTVWPGIGSAILLFAVLSIYISHKIAGPLYRLKKALSLITEGNLDAKVKLRKGDDLQDLAEQLNVLVEELRTFVTAMSIDYGLLSDYILEIERQIKANVLTEELGKKIIKKVQDSRKNIEAALEKFKIQR